MIALLAVGCLQYHSDSLATDEIALKARFRTDSDDDLNAIFDLRAGRGTKARDVKLTGDDALFIELAEGGQRDLDRSAGRYRGTVPRSDGDIALQIVLDRSGAQDDATAEVVIPDFELLSPSPGDVLGKDTMLEWTNPRLGEEINLTASICEEDDLFEVYEALPDSGSAAVPETVFEALRGSCDVTLKLQRVIGREDVVDSGLRNGWVKQRVARRVTLQAP